MKKIENLNLRVLTFVLTAGFVFSSPVNVLAQEGDILYIQEEDEHEEVDLTEQTKEDMIEAEEARNENQGNGQGGTTENEDKENLDEEENLGEETSPGEGTGEETGSEDGSGNTEEDKKEYGKDEFIDGDNWSQDKDIVENAGNEIPDTVETEWERKHPVRQ